MRTTIQWLVAGMLVPAVLLGGSATGCASPLEKQAAAILERLPGARGICVLLDPQPAELAVAMARQSKLTIYLQLADDQSTDSARKVIDGAGLLGTRVYVEKGAWKRIHLADNLADAVVATPAAADAAGAHRAELLRVVNPLGKLFLAEEEVRKPMPKEADDWSHPYHGPDNNPQSADRLARAPYLTQFQAEPWYVPFPVVTVTSSGRLFKAIGHIAYKKREWPWLNTLVAMNGFNGTILWTRPLEEGFNIHRNTLIATPEVLYLADSRSCKMLDAATGKLKGEISAPKDSSGLVWKWMALEDGVLYAMLGETEFRDQTHRTHWDEPGWPWQPMTAGYDGRKFPWGFGRTLCAIDPKTKQVLWTHNEEAAIDGRAICLRGGRIYYYSHPNFLACLDAKAGKPLWRTSEPKLLEAIGPHFRAQDWQYGFSTTAYMKCSDEAIYFAGPQRPRLVAASTADGRLLWQFPAGNFQIVLHDGGLYAMGSRNPCVKLDPLTGKVLAEFDTRRAACTRATGTIDSIFCRGEGPGPLGDHMGTLRWVTADDHPTRIGLMRPPCHDGVIAANGLLYWGAWMCDCNLSLVGNLALAPAGDFDFAAAATDAERREATPAPTDSTASVTPSPPHPLTLLPLPGDWPTYRADNQRSSAAKANVPAKITLAWQYQSPAAVEPAAPITAGDLVFVSGSDGVIRAIAANDGKSRWTAYTAGPIQFPPAIDKGQLVVGSGDGWVYAFDAATGRRLWRFRAAPAERKVNLGGHLSSNWPVASGAMVADGAVYAAAGLASYDGTHVYALDAATGKIRWQNNASGHLASDGKMSGVSVQGHLLLNEDRLYLAGGNVVSPAVYDLKDGRCLNALADEWVKAPRGRELFLVDGNVVAFDQLLYGPKEYQRSRNFAQHFVQAQAGDVIIRGTTGRIGRIAPPTSGEKEPKFVWQSNHFEHPAALALGHNALVVAGRLPGADGQSPPRYALVALAVEDGRLLWSQPLRAMPVAWGLALDHAGRIVVATEDGRISCFAPLN